MGPFRHASFLSLAVAWALAAPPARANEIRAAATPSRHFVIHDAAETLERWCARDDEGGLWLELPGGERFELVTSVDDSAILNRGDGGFHTFDAGEIGHALDELGFPAGAIAAEVFILPFPRRGGLESAAGPGLILLAPGVRPLSRDHQHAEFIHELGHVVQYALLPDSGERWTAYRRMRGIEDPELYSASAIHANRPHEIFAEDFRALFGGAAANYSGTIENPALEAPATIAGLREFLLELANVQRNVGRIAAAPNPARGPIRFSHEGGAAVPLDLFDPAGRRIATLEPTVNGAGVVEWRWDRRDAGGRAIGRTVVFARARGAAGGALRVSLID